MENKEEELIRKLREAVGLQELHSDEEILKLTEGTYIRSLIEVDIAFQMFGMSFEKEIEQIRKKMSKHIEKYLSEMLSS